METFFLYLFSGLEGFPTCNVHGRALEHVTRIINRKFHNTSDTRLTPIIGISIIKYYKIKTVYFIEIRRH